jgi:hypothetical protein
MLRAPVAAVGPEIHPTPSERFPALDILEASSLAEARLIARLVLERAPPCGCCASLLAHLVDRLGSVLFLDDDPRRLAASFPGGVPSLRQIAAVIVLYGRPRIDLFPHA